MTWDYCLLDKSLDWASNTDTQLLADLLTLNALLSTTHIEGKGWDALRSQSIRATKQALLLEQQEQA